jgi:hypothetical protein
LAVDAAFFVFGSGAAVAAGRRIGVVVPCATRYILLVPANVADGLIACSSCSRSRCSA